MRRPSLASLIASLVPIAIALSGSAVPVGAHDDAVRPLFDLAAPAGSPFPSDRFTLPEPRNVTGLAVHLPKPDCTSRPSECEDVDVLNTLDGFSLQPRLSIPFDGAIDVATVTSDSVFLVQLGTPARIGINQVVWDTFTDTLHLQADEQLEQHTQYLLVVTGAIRDADGRRVKAAEHFRREDASTPYLRDLKRALAIARASGEVRGEILVASLFTTQSATSTLEKIRDQIAATTPDPATFSLAADGTRTVFPLSEITGITWNQQTGANPTRFTASELNIAVVRRIPGAVATMAFGRYRSPDYQVHPGEFIPPTPTGDGSPVVQTTQDIYLNLFLPSGIRPSGGWPVVIFEHGTGASKNGRTTGNADNVLSIAATMASHGLATVAINANGHGYGELGTLTVRRSSGAPVLLTSGGRSFDQNGDGTIGNAEGAEATAPRTLQLNRDGQIQTIADLLQLVRVIRTGVDADANGTTDLDPARIYFLGHSLGSMAGVNLVAVEPGIRAAVFNVPGAPLVENRRLGPVFRSSGSAIASSSPANLFAARQPSLLNGPGITAIAGVPVPPGPSFDENMPPRDGAALQVQLADGSSREIRSPVVNTVRGAMEIQQWFDRAAWAAQAANPAAYAPHLRRKPLSGMTARPVLFQFALGDQASPNPNNMTILRAGDLADRAIFFRNDRAFAENPSVTKNPHGFMLNIASPVPLVAAIARGVQEQIATFFASDGGVIISAEPARLFESPAAVGPAVEELNYIP